MAYNYEKEEIRHWKDYMKKVMDFFSELGVEAYEELIKYAKENRKEKGHSDYRDVAKRHTVKRIKDNLELVELRDEKREALKKALEVIKNE